MSIVIWTIVFAVATAFWFSAAWCVHFRWDSDIRSRCREMISLPVILGASAFGFGTTLVLAFLHCACRFATRF
jgi:hypothetical protein